MVDSDPIVEALARFTVSGRAGRKGPNAADVVATGSSAVSHGGRLAVGTTSSSVVTERAEATVAAREDAPWAAADLVHGGCGVVDGGLAAAAAAAATICGGVALLASSLVAAAAAAVQGTGAPANVERAAAPPLVTGAAILAAPAADDARHGAVAAAVVVVDYDGFEATPRGILALIVPVVVVVVRVLVVVAVAAAAATCGRQRAAADALQLEHRARTVVTRSAEGKSSFCTTRRLDTP